ncbi:efflux RND transporter periplasmic adaptor subunit [Fusobacterium sp. oral taxon 203]|uniref:efflux RND transporter periplasmic adaptor subunit n=1 Tax=Fusobacterium sp. oral taxon 203 TaxID=671211 RepID=UPI000B92D591|nr:efflux RND transporter periplasmic adaptor subunit [Fusobacterium sp. oral taxon 203]ASS39662.1 efflux transporter periplasmic adaptor subunit [Fusobacterium sp. oral taxon 203]
MKKILTIFLAASLLLVACGKDKEDEKKDTKQEVAVTEEQQVVKSVEVAAITKREMSKLFESSAVWEPLAKVDFSTDKGGTVKTIYKKNGEYVKKGEVIVKLSDAQTEADFLQAKANYVSATSNFNIAKNNYQKFKTLYDKQLISYLEFSNYEASYTSAQGNLEVAKAAYMNVQKSYSKLVARAEINGVVGNLFIKEGNDIAAKEILFTILNDKQMQSYVGITPEAISKVKIGDEIKVKIDALGKEYMAKITELNPIADSTTKNFKVKLALDNPDGEIKDGMFGNVIIPVGESSVLSVEDEAIVTRDLVNYVFKYEDGKAKQVEVTVGATNLPYTEISSPEIKEGDKIIVKGLFGLQNNDTVEIKNEVNK